MLDAKSLDEFIKRYQVNGILWKADYLLSNLDSDILFNDRCKEVAGTLALIPDSDLVLRDGYLDKICKEHNIKTRTLQKYIDDALKVNEKRERKEKSKKKKGIKNRVRKLEGNPSIYPFFQELTKQTKNGTEFSGVKIDKLKFVRLLSHFGFSRYDGASATDDDKFNFIRLKENVIQSVTRNKIIDFVETFIMDEYDFKSAGCEHVDEETLINCLYDQSTKIFSKDLFARVRTEHPIIISADRKQATYFYYQNGFVEITKDDWKLISYSEMNGSVWENQMLNRKFKYQPPVIDQDADGNPIGSKPGPDGMATNVMKAGYFADFCCKISGDNEQRFLALCSILGYLTHDYYDYTLRAVEFTDSTISEASEGRTGKTLLTKMAGQVRSYCEIPGKTFKQDDERKYQMAEMGTQFIHINDVNNKGRNKFDFELMFNDITEGIEVRKLYMAPFVLRCKIAISTNKSLNIEGPSMRARIVEFEMSDFFSETRRVNDYYGHWFMRDWSDDEWIKFDNFMCFCAKVFHNHGLIEPVVINLNERKLFDHTHPDFLDFMNSVSECLKTRGIPWEGFGRQGSLAEFKTTMEIHEFKFDRRMVYDHLKNKYPDLNAEWFKMQTLTSWMVKFSELRLGVRKPKKWESNGRTMMQFIPDDKPNR